MALSKFRDGADAYVLRSLALFPVLVALRVYEYMIVRQSHILPPSAAADIAIGLRADVGVLLWIALVLAIPILALTTWSLVAASRVHRVILVVIVLGMVALVQYFAVTFVPLGADLFGYSLEDIRATTSASRGVGIGSLLAFAIAGIATWIVTGAASRLRTNHAVTTLVALGALLALVRPAVFVPQAKNYGTDGEFFLAHNTAAYFSAQAFGHFERRLFAPKTAEFATKYPLLHRATDDDVLGPQFTTATAKPNLVFVIVEGLGRDFVGEGAAFGGFTPFLDSLAGKSLFWSNFTSTSGRTFGVLPALLASAPVVEGGLLEMGAQMPRTLTLQKLLKARDYTTNYFTGTDGHFDMIDLFLEAQGIDSLIDASKFGPGYEKEPAAEGGVSWGYADDDLFKRSFASIASPVTPRLDVYLTITTHEPFIPPHQAEYAARFDKRLASMTVNADKRAEYQKYASVFQTLLYLDDAMRHFIDAYSRRADFSRTIFFITGDHRLIPIPPANRIDRYRVPFIVYSPLLKEPHVIASVSSHQDVVPSVIAMLRHSYGMTFPDTVPWVGSGLDTARGFRNTHSLALMRTKSSLDEYLDGSSYLSGGELFSVSDGLSTAPAHDPAVQAALAAKLARAAELGRVVATENRIVPGNAADSMRAAEVKRVNSAFAALQITGKNPEELFNIARDKASTGEYDQARVICRKLLLDAPNYHDARALLGRSYAWQRNFGEARPILSDLVQRAPMYEDGYLALANMEVWADHGAAALDVVNRGLARFPNDKDLRATRVRALAEVAAGAR